MAEALAQSVVEKRETGYYVRGSRIALDSLVYLWRQGSSDVAIRESYPSLELREVAGAIEFYLSNKAEVDEWIEQSEKEEEEFVAQARASAPEFIRRLEKLRSERRTQR